jgi:hypothetical protein
VQSAARPVNHEKHLSFVVIAGLDPAIHEAFPLWHGPMDCRIKSGNDKQGKRQPGNDEKSGCPPVYFIQPHLAR